MAKILTIAELKKMAVAKEMPLGITEAPFDHMEYKVDEERKNEVTGVRVYLKGFLPIFLPFFEGEISYQLSYLLSQLGVESYDIDEINKTAGTIVKVSRYLKETEQTYSKEDFKKFLDKYEGQPPTYIEINETDDGGAIVKNTFTNTNFNLKTIKE